MKRHVTPTRPGAPLHRRMSLCCCLLFSVPAFVDTPAEASTPKVRELAELSLEQLSAIVVTSVSRREQALNSAAASIFVISAEDIRRAGVNSLPEALRLAPNLQVARTDTNQYAISARGFNNPVANRLLVLIDGRTVYSPLFSGVFWDVQDIMLENVERIEVISGPGATLWGANAVNGVINVITRSARDTQGTLVAAGGGNRQRGGAVRYGGRFGEDAYYRVYGKYMARNAAERVGGASAVDASERSQAGFRVDGGSDEQEYMVRGDAYVSNVDQLIGGERNLSGGNLLARWKQRWDDGSFLRIQSYYDYARRDQPGSFIKNLDILDFELQHGMLPASNHTLLWGGGYRYAKDDLSDVNPNAFAFIPEDRELHWYHLFVQDDWNVRPDITLTAGIKAEHNDYTGLEWLPNVRAAWSYAQDRLVWAAVSRSVRAPSRLDRELYLPGRPPYTLAGGPNFVSEVSVVYELGYRAQPSDGFSFSVTAFYHDHEKLRGMEPSANGNVLTNNMEGNTNGVEAWANYKVMKNWKLDVGWTELRQRLRARPGSVVTSSPAFVGNDPHRFITLRSSIDFTPRHEFDLVARYVGELPNPAVAAYVAMDMRLGWRVTKDMQLSLLLQNLFDDAHPEWGTAPTAVEFPRAIFLKMIWQS